MFKTRTTTWKNIVFFLSYVTARPDASELVDCDGHEQWGNSSGRIAIVPNPNYRNIDYLMIFPNRTEMFMMNISISTEHKSPYCYTAIDFVVLPDGYKQCVNDEFCHVYVPPDADVTNLQTLYSVSSVSGRCGANLTKAAKWPPRICVKGRQPSFELGITYQFVEMGDAQQDPAPVYQLDDSTLGVIMAVVIPATVIVIIATIFACRRKSCRKRTRSAFEIAPYAVHVSIRRGLSLNTAQKEQMPGNVYDNVENATSGQNNDYLQPIVEQTYCEIQNCEPTDAALLTPSRRVYDIAEGFDTASPEQKRHETGHGNNFDGNNSLTDESTFVGVYGETGVSVGYMEMSPTPGSSRNLDSFDYNSADSLLAANDASRTEYSEIVATMKEGRSLERLHSCQDKYKSVRKKKRP
ncbi:unnamed protein product [Clavelina lepadiformis]|uniref:CUB domain-containing protein n=1 Tax=Clavelina lepadiformis TaxID=159417 RepID=A0ABP0FPR5_CLALP